MRWDAARIASRRQLPKPRKMHGPVGEVPPPNGELRAAWDEDGNAFAIACKACGHDVCNCKPKNDGPDCPYCGQDDCPAECRSDAPAPPNGDGPIVNICGLCHSYDHATQACQEMARGFYR